MVSDPGFKAGLNPVRARGPRGFRGIPGLPGIQTAGGGVSRYRKLAPHAGLG